MRKSDIRNFEFGNKMNGEWISQFALHIQCPWRIEHHDFILTGKSDMFMPEGNDEDIDWDIWDPYVDLTRQDELLRDLFPDTNSHKLFLINSDDKLKVENVNADKYGGACIHFSNDYRLVLFPDCSRDEDWRIFDVSTDLEHFIVGQYRLSNYK